MGYLENACGSLAQQLMVNILAGKFLLWYQKCGEIGLSSCIFWFKLVQQSPLATQCSLTLQTDTKGACSSLTAFRLVYLFLCILFCFVANYSLFCLIVSEIETQKPQHVTEDAGSYKQYRRLPPLHIPQADKTDVKKGKPDLADIFRSVFPCCVQGKTLHFCVKLV